MFKSKNQVSLTKNGLIASEEKAIFRIFALYKWNGGKLQYDQIKREYLLRRKYFKCYEVITIMPTNIIMQFVEELCPDNYVCVDPNGIIINSKGNDPALVFSYEIANNKELKAVYNSTIPNSYTNPNLLREGAKPEITSDFNSLLKSEANPSEYYNLQSTYSSNNNNLVPSNKNLILSANLEYTNKFDKLYSERTIKIAKKKEIIINKLFNLKPIFGEILAVANSDKISLNQTFIERETNLLKKYLLIYDANIPFIETAATNLLNLLLCDNDKNNLKYLLQELLEGLCNGDDVSIETLAEIIRTVIVDSIGNYMSFVDLNAKVNLINTFNKVFCFTTVQKIRFVENMLLLDAVKEKVINIIWENNSNEKISEKVISTEKSIPSLIKNNKRIFNKYLGLDNIDSINASFPNNLNFRFKQSTNKDFNLQNINLNANKNNRKNNSNLSLKFKQLDTKNLLKKENKDIKEEEKDLMDEFNKFETIQPKFKQISNTDQFALTSLNKFNNLNDVLKNDESKLKNTVINNPLTPQDILNKVLSDPETKNLVDKATKDPNSKVIMPQEIHAAYEIKTKTSKQVTINQNSKHLKNIKLSILFFRSNKKANC